MDIITLTRRQASRISSLEKNHSGQAIFVVKLITVSSTYITTRKYWQRTVQ